MATTRYLTPAAVNSDNIIYKDKTWKQKNNKKKNTYTQNNENWSLSFTETSYDNNLPVSTGLHTRLSDWLKRKSVFPDTWMESMIPRKSKNKNYIMMKYIYVEALN